MNTANNNMFSFGGSFYNNNIGFGFVNLAQICEISLIAGSGFPPHTQVCHEITYIVSGTGIFRTGDTEFRVRQGDIHVIAKGDVHEIIASPSEQLRYICIGFNLNDVPEEYSEVKYFYEHSPKTVMSCGNYIGCLFEMLIGEFYRTMENHDEAVEQLLKLILIRVKRCFTEEDASGTERGIHNCNTVYKVLRYIDSHVATMKSVGEVSKKLHYTESYISSLFRQKMGVTLQTYLRDKKLDSAKMLLEYGGRTVMEVSELMNFDSPRSFSKSFKKRYGMTPHRYLEEKKNNERINKNDH